MIRFRIQCLQILKFENSNLQQKKRKKKKKKEENYKNIVHSKLVTKTQFGKPIENYVHTHTIIKHTNKTYLSNINSLLTSLNGNELGTKLLSGDLTP